MTSTYADPQETIDARYARWDGVGRPFTMVCTRTPAVPRAGEVLVRIDLATVCGSDLHSVSGRRPSPAPGVLGHEQVGTVLAVGAGAPPRRVDGSVITPGTRIVWAVTSSCGACDRCRADLPQKCRQLRKYGHEPLTGDWELSGGFATHCVLRAGTAVVAVPDGLPDEVAAPASCATATVAACLAAAALTPATRTPATRTPAGPDRRATAGARVLVTGAGMLGLTAVAMAARGGAHVVAVDPHPERRAAAVAFGATEAFEPGVDIDGIDVAVELSGAPGAVRAGLASLAVGGTLVLAGSVSPGAGVEIDPERLVRNLHTVVGVHNYRPADLQTAVDFLAASPHPFAELVAGRFPLDRIDQALAAAATGTAARQALAPND